jgi:hypothetical protein
MADAPDIQESATTSRQIRLNQNLLSFTFTSKNGAAYQQGCRWNHISKYGIWPSEAVIDIEG